MIPNPVSDPERAYDDVADGAMLAGIAAGDQDAFRRLHHRYAGLLYAAIHRLLGDPADTEEILQEVLNSLWHKADQYHPGRGRPITWLASTARNRAIDRLRARKRQARLKNAYTQAIDFVPRSTSSVTGPEAASRRDTCEAVRSAVMELTENQREAIEKVYFEGLTQQQIADQLGEPLGTVKARIRRGLAKLRQTIGEE
jgi:RNA polymerase sigma-70 factor (ECF subfamily)